MILVASPGAFAGPMTVVQDCPVNADGARRIPLLFQRLGVTSIVFDLNARVALSQFLSAATRRGLAHAQRSLRLLSTDGFSAQARVRPVRRALSRQSTDPPLLLFRSIPLH